MFNFQANIRDKVGALAATKAECKRLLSDINEFRETKFKSLKILTSDVRSLLNEISTTLNSVYEKEGDLYDYIFKYNDIADFNNDPHFFEEEHEIGVLHDISYMKKTWKSLYFNRFKSSFVSLPKI